MPVSGTSSCLPSKISLKPRMVSFTSMYLPFKPMKASATKNGWLKNFCALRARPTKRVSSSLNSSIPKIAIMSCNSRIALQQRLNVTRCFVVFLAHDEAGQEFAMSIATGEPLGKYQEPQYHDLGLSWHLSA